MDDLLNLALTHELGHALCNERNERKADANGDQWQRAACSMQMNRSLGRRV